MATARRAGRRWPSGSQSCPEVSLSPTGPGAARARPGRPARVRRPAEPIGALAASGDGRQAARRRRSQHDGEIVAGAAVEEVDGGTRDLDEVAPRRDQVGQASQQVDLDQAALDVERRRQRQGERRGLDRRADRSNEAQGRLGTGRARRRRAGRPAGEIGRSGGCAAPRARPRSTGSAAGRSAVAAAAAARGPRLLGGREEALEVAEAVAPIAPLVDAVEPEPSLVAPRPDRVGVDAQEAGRLRDGEGRVGRTRRELRGRIPRRHRSSRPGCHLVRHRGMEDR